MTGCTKDCAEQHTYTEGCELMVPPRPMTDEEFADLSVLSMAEFQGGDVPVLPAALVLEVGEQFLNELRDAGLYENAQPPIADGEYAPGGIQPRVIDEPPKTVMDVKATISVFEGMGPLAYSSELAEADEDGFEITWVRLIPTGLRCVVEKDGVRRTVDLHEHDLMILMAETGIAAFTQADEPTATVAAPAEGDLIVVGGVGPVPSGWERIEGVAANEQDRAAAVARVREIVADPLTQEAEAKEAQRLITEFRIMPSEIADVYPETEVQGGGGD